MKNIIKCKLCDKDLHLSSSAGSITEFYPCVNCDHYELLLFKNTGNIEESIFVNKSNESGGFYFVFSKLEKVATVYKENEYYRSSIIAEINMKTLTPELAKKWLLKMKTYTVFQ